MHSITRPLALLAGLGLAFGAAAYAPTAQASPHVTVGVRIGVPPPPPPVRVVHVRPRPGYAWAPGYWRWSPRIHRHVWREGYWVRARPGRHYRPARWERHGRDWRFHRGHWDR
ncbi:hypothetical protein ACFWZ3_03035 [Frateuria sp. GZRR35]|uniref:YXWGXW repeat-containing protein n=1 Tax=Frateuria sp. GZRR35 TaxID=3351536 RepID=UPI003EDC199A